MKEEKCYFIYILASKRNGTLYIGVTNGLMKRTFQYKLNTDKDGFTVKYTVDKLVYYEIYDNIELAIGREKKLKKWKRAWKIELIEKDNITW